MDPRGTLRGVDNNQAPNGRQRPIDARRQTVSASNKCMMRSAFLASSAFIIYHHHHYHYHHYNHHHNHHNDQRHPNLQHFEGAGAV